MTVAIPVGRIKTVVLDVVPVTKSVVVAFCVVAPVTFSNKTSDPPPLIAILERVRPVLNMCVSFVLQAVSYTPPLNSTAFVVSR